MLEESRPSPLPAPLGRLTLIVTFVLVGLTLLFVLDLPSQQFDFSLLGSEGRVELFGTFMLGVILAALTAAGVDSIARTHPRVHLADRRYLFILWIAPAMVVVAATIILSGASAREVGLIGVALVGVFLAIVILGEYFTIDLSDRWYSHARLGVNLSVYILALVWIVTIYSWKIRALFSAPALGLAAGLLALELFRGAESELRRTWLYAAAVGLAMGEILWAMNYWNLNARTGSIVLLTFFYALTGLTQQFLWGRLTRLVWFEFGFIIVGALALLYFWRPA